MKRMAKKNDIFKKLTDIQHNDLVSQLCDGFLKESLNVSNYPLDASPNSLQLTENELNSSDILVEKEGMKSRAKRRTKQNNKTIKKSTKNVKSTSKPGKAKISTVVDETIDIDLDNAYNTIHSITNSPPSNGTRKSLRLLQANHNNRSVNAGLFSNNESIAFNEYGDTIPFINDNNVNVATKDAVYLPSQSHHRRRRVMCDQRRRLAEKVTQNAEHMEHIDLTQSPTISLSEYIDLTSENDNEHKAIEKQRFVNYQNDDVHSVKEVIDEENCEMNIRINWMNRIEHFQLRKHQKFKHIFQLLADREQISPHRILLNINDRILNMSDTPNSVDYKCFQCIYGRVMDSGCFMTSNQNFKKAENVLLVKVQSSIWKKPVHFDIVKTDSFHILYIKCAEEANMSINEFKLSINGEILEHDATPVDLEIEEGEVIDLSLKK